MQQRRLERVGVAQRLVDAGTELGFAARHGGQAAVAGYLVDEQGGFSAHGIELFTLEGGRIAGIMAFLDASMFARFGLPDRVV